MFAGGIGRIAEVLVDVIRSIGSDVHLSTPVAQITLASDGSKATGVRFKSGEVIIADRGVICNTDIWSLPRLLDDEQTKLTPEQHQFFFKNITTKVATKSFLHLHLGLDMTGIDLSTLKPHYTVMAKGLHSHDPCADRNMVAVSVPSLLDDSLAGKDRFVVHAYSAGNEGYEDWRRYDAAYNSRFNTGNEVLQREYEDKKTLTASFLFDSVSRALGISVDDVKARAEVSLIGTPLTHKRYLSRHEGSYGAAFDSMLGMLSI